MHLLSLLEVLLERVGEALRVLDELALPLLERLLARAARDVAGDLVHRVKQLLDGARDLPAKDGWHCGRLGFRSGSTGNRNEEVTLHELDGLEEGLPVGDLVGYSGEDLLERQRLLVQLLEGLLGAAGLVLCICKGREKEGSR